MTQHITLGGLPLVNLKRKPFRTAALTIVVAMLTVAFYGGSLLSMNLEAGLNSMQERMGADLMVTPQNTKNEAEALLTNGSASTFYFTNEITDEVAKADGIDEITEQTYISSLAAACCDEKVQIIGFNPDTDFVITLGSHRSSTVRSSAARSLQEPASACRATTRSNSMGTNSPWRRNSPIPARRSTIPCS